MTKNNYEQFLKRFKKVNKLVDEETRKLSFKEKLKQVASLLLFASQTKISFRKDKHLFTNWTLLKSKA